MAIHPVDNPQVPETRTSIWLVDIVTVPSEFDITISVGAENLGAAIAEGLPASVIYEETPVPEVDIPPAFFHFFEENPEPENTVSTAMRTYYSNFVNAFDAYGENTGPQGAQQVLSAVINSIDFGSYGVTITFPQNLSSVPILDKPRADNRTGVGRFNTTTAGTGRSTWYFDTATAIRLEFSTPIAAFGFYAMDVGDFFTKMTMICETPTSVYQFPLPHLVGAENGKLMFFGFYCPETIVAVNIYNSGSYATGSNDGYGFDDFFVVLPTDVPENLTLDYAPDPWPYPPSTFLLAHFNSVGSTNIFPIDVVRWHPSLLQSLEDSVANSTTHGSFDTSVKKFGMGSYKCIDGNYLTYSTVNPLTDPPSEGRLSAQLGEEWTAEGFIYINGTPVGDGTFFKWGPLRIYLDANRKMGAELTYGSELGGEISIFWDSALSLSTWHHWRLSKDFYLGVARFRLYINGSVRVSSPDFVAVPLPLENPLEDPILIGGSDASNYVPANHDAVGFYNYVAAYNDTYTVPTAPNATALR
jgi:hypothetical protein